MLSESRIDEIIVENEPPDWANTWNFYFTQDNMMAAIKQAIKEERRLICDYLDDEHHASHREEDVAYAIDVVREGGPNA